MYIRATRVQAPPDKIKDSIQNFETNVLKRVKAAPGYQGAVLLVNRQTGDGIGITYWESAKALGGSEQAGICLLYTSPSPRDLSTSRMPSSA